MDKNLYTHPKHFKNLHLQTENKDVKKIKLYPSPILNYGNINFSKKEISLSPSISYLQLYKILNEQNLMKKKNIKKLENNDSSSTLYTTCEDDYNFLENKSSFYFSKENKSVYDDFSSTDNQTYEDDNVYREIEISPKSSFLKEKEKDKDKNSNFLNLSEESLKKLNEKNKIFQKKKEIDVDSGYESESDDDYKSIFNDSSSSSSSFDFDSKKTKSLETLDSIFQENSNNHIILKDKINKNSILNNNNESITWSNMYLKLPLYFSNEFLEMNEQKVKKNVHDIGKTKEYLEKMKKYLQQNYILAHNEKNIFFMDDYYTILKLLSSLKSGEKLRIIINTNNLFSGMNEKKIEIDKRTLPQIARWWSQDNRYDTIQYLEQFFACLLIFIHENTEKEEILLFEEHQLKTNISLLLNYLENSIHGLYNLKETYENDFQIQLKIQILIHTIQFHLMKQKKQFILKK